MAHQSEQIVRPAFTPVQQNTYRRRPTQQAGTASTDTGPGNDSDGDENIAGPAGAGVVSMEAGPHQGTVQEVKEAIERAIFKVAYAGLERHPDAAPREKPPREKTATTVTDILRSTISSTMANSHVRLRVDELDQLFVDRGGVSWALKGRGPFYTHNSSVIDCMITAGKLLDAGSTNADRSDSRWETRLNRLQRAFIELSDANWDLCSPEAGAQMKEVLIQMVQQSVPQFGDQTPDAVALLWRMVAQHLGQFALKIDQTSTPCRCSAAPGTSETKQTCFIVPQFQRLDEVGVGMQTLFERTFQPRLISRCGGCGEDGDVLERSFYPLPLRMAVTLDPRVSIVDHMRDIHVTYRPSGEVEADKHATYRWLGGIYQNAEGAYRVFWNDTKRGEVNHGRVCQYDPTLEGLIVSEERQGPPPEHRVPPKWWYNRPVPLLFYERAMNPSEDLLNAARNTIKEMWNDYTTGVPTLVSHEPWPTTEHMPPSKSGYPWQPPEVAKPPDAQRFHIADEPYGPAGQAIAAPLPPRDTYNSGWNDFTLPPLRSANLLSAARREDLTARSRASHFAAPPNRSSAYSTMRGGVGASRLSSGVLNLGLTSPPPAAANVNEDVDMEMLDVPQSNKRRRNEADDHDGVARR